MKQADEYSVLVVEDHHMIKLGLKAFAQTNTSVAVQWFEADTLADALKKFREHDGIDLVMLDLKLPDSQGLKSVQRFLAEFPTARIVIHSATEDEFVMRQAMALGCVDFIPKSLPADLMLERLFTLLASGRESSNPDSGHALPAPPAAQHGSTAECLHTCDVLTSTQLKVLELLLDGLSNRQIADECQLALGTVKNTVSSIMLTLNVNSRSQLISLFH